MVTNYETIKLQRDDQPVDWLTLNRPESLNALNVPMVSELRDYFGSLKENSETRVVVLQGAGRAFCAGLDIKEATTQQHETPFGNGMGFQGYLAEVYLLMRHCPQPIISLIQGPACGGGFALALASDIRIAATDMKMNAAFIRIGLSAFDMGVSYFLPRLVGTSIASELMLTGKFILADRALNCGLVSEVVNKKNLKDTAGDYIEDMLATSPMGLRLTKDGLNMAIDASSLEAAMAIENRNQVLCSSTEDAKEGMLAFIEKRKPQYNGR